MFRKRYSPSPLSRFEAVGGELPAPVCDAKPLWGETCWKAWELAFKNFHEPTQQSGFVSQFIDAAFNENIFLWDSCFMTMFCNYAHPLVPGISTLDNCYAKQYEDGEISRAQSRGRSRRWGWPGYQEEASAERNAPVIYKKGAPLF